jgi:hypothetical protein
VSRILAGIAGIGVLGVVVAGCGGGGANKAGGQAAHHVAVLTLANTSGEIDPSLQLFVDAVGRRSHGTVQIEFRSNYRPGDPNAERDTIRDVQSGRAQLA